MKPADLRNSSDKEPNTGHPLDGLQIQQGPKRSLSDSGAAFPRVSHADYAWALSKLRRSGLNPTLEAIYREIEWKHGKPPQPTEEQPAVARPEESYASLPSRRHAVAYAESEKAREAPPSAIDHGSPAEVRNDEAHQEALAALEQQVAHYRTVIEEVRQKEVALRGQMELLSQELAGAKSSEMEMAKWKALHDDAAARAEALENEIEEMKVDAVLAESLENLIQEQRLSLESTGQRVEALTAQLQESSAKASRVEGLQSSLIALQSEVEALREREQGLITNLSHEQIARHEAEQKLNSRSQTSLPFTLEQYQDLAESKRLLELQLVHLRRSETSLQQQLEARAEETERLSSRLNKEIQDLRANYSDVASDLNHITAERDLAIQSHQKLLEEIGEYSRSNEKILDSLRQAESSILHFRENEKTFERELEVARQNAFSEAESLREQIECLQQEIEGLRNRETELTQQLGEARGLAESTTLSFQSQLEQLNAKLAESLNRESHLEDRARIAEERAAGFESLQSERDQDRQELEALRHKQASLIQELEESRKRETAPEALLAELNDLRERESALVQRLESAEHQASLTPDLKSELQAKRNELSELKVSETLLREQLNAAAQKESESLGLLREIEALRSRETELVQRMEKAEQQVAESEILRVELEKEKTELLALQEREASLHQQVDSLLLDQKDTAELGRKLALHQAELSQMQARETSLQLQLDEARNRAAEANAASTELLSLQETVRQLREREKELEEQLSSAEESSLAAKELRSLIEKQQAEIERLREIELSSAIDPDWESQESGRLRALQQELDEHRSALADTRNQNERLMAQLETSFKVLDESARPRSRVFPYVMAAIIAGLLAVAGVAGVRFFPEMQDLKKNAEAVDQLKIQNDKIAAELNDTLLRLQSAKETEISIDRIRNLTARLEAAELRAKELESEAPANLARMTQLQSDLELTRSRLQRLSTELAARDIRILELERLLGEVGSESLQISTPPPMSLASPELSAAMMGISEPLAPQNSEWSDFAADSLKTLQSQAEEAFKAKNFAMAEVLFQRVADAAPRNPLALSNLAAAQLELGKLALAKSNIRAALAIKPDDAFSLTTLGVIQIKTGEADLAIESLLRAIALDSSAADSFNYLGVAFDTKGDRTRAIEEIQKAIQISPTYADAHFNLAVLHAHGGAEELPLARKHYEEALQLGSNPDPELGRLLQ